MEMDKVFQVNGGTGEGSYAKNSKMQKVLLSKSAAILEQAVVDMCNSSAKLAKCVVIADLGCSSGPNSLAAITNITAIIYNTWRQRGQSPPELTVFLNDLTCNDFNTVFESLPAFREKMREEWGGKVGPCCVAGVPGSFYGRLFPSRSLHFVHSSSSVHWLSQVPPELTSKETPVLNKGRIYMSASSPPQVINAYSNQFCKDFFSFLRWRSEEIAPLGRMLLVFAGRRTPHPTSHQTCLLWDYLGQAFQELVLQGVIEEEKLDSYNTPYYEACIEEVRGEIDKEGSFDVASLDTIEMSLDGVNEGRSCDRETIALLIGKGIRAVTESMIQNHFGSEILDPLFQKFTKIMAHDTKVVDHISFVVSLIRKT